MLIGASQRLDALAGELRRAHEWIAAAQWASSSGPSGLLDASLAYYDGLADVLAKWHERSLFVDAQQEAEWAEQRRRQQLIDRKTVLAYSGGTWIDVFPWGF